MLGTVVHATPVRVDISQGNFVAKSISQANFLRLPRQQSLMTYIDIGFKQKREELKKLLLKMDGFR